MIDTPLERFLKRIFLLQEPLEEELEEEESMEEDVTCDAPVLSEFFGEPQEEDILEQEQPERLHQRTKKSSSLRKMMRAHEIFSLPVSLRRNNEK